MSTLLQNELLIMFILKFNYGWSSSDLLAKRTVTQKFFAQILQSLISLNQIFLHLSVAVFVSNHHLSFTLLQQGFYDLAASYNLIDYLSRKLHLINDLDGLDMKVVLFVIVFDYTLKLFLNFSHDLVVHRIFRNLTLLDVMAENIWNQVFFSMLQDPCD